MTRLTFIVVFFCWALSIKAQPSSQDALKAVSHRVSSIKKLSDGIGVNQMVILRNQNINSFIHDLQTSPIKISHKLTEIPRSISAFLESFSPDKFTIANPGKDWNCCCDRIESLPNRQLISIGNNGHLFWMIYRSGGIAEIQHLILISYKGDQINDFWTGMVHGNLNDNVAIVKALKERKYGHWASRDRIDI